MMMIVAVDSSKTNVQLLDQISLDISTSKDSLTDTSEISLDFTEIVEKDKNNLGHIMISYDQSTRAICMKISKYLKVRKCFLI